MNNDMKTIMENWKKGIAEVGLQDVGAGVPPMYDSDGNPVYTKLQNPEKAAETLYMTAYWIARIFDPIGWMSWEDLGKSWQEYTQNLNLDDDLDIGEVTLRLANGFIVALDGLDSVPAVAFFAKGLKPARVAVDGLKNAAQALKKMKKGSAAAKANKLANKIEKEMIKQK